MSKSNEKNNNKMNNIDKWEDDNNTKTLPEVLPSKVTSLGVFDFWFKQMITELIITKNNY